MNEQPRPAQIRIENGTLLSDGMGTNYVVSNITSHSLTLQRQFPKIRGKARVKALKKQRREVRERQARELGRQAAHVRQVLDDPFERELAAAQERMQ